ncbi:biotin/lipoyl-binding protein [Selenomonas sputigena]|uniref:Biotin/lipoyl-binding protein n=1 Tax=Selenomonas sputigena TaxID=69823 RepID=A0ABV3X5W6_9FIRM
MKKFNIKVNGTSYEVEVEEEKVAGAAPAPKAAAAPAAPKAAAPAAPAAPAKAAVSAGAGETSVNAPMPGKIVKVLVSEGQAVNSGDVLLILEAMKMQNEIAATQSGTVKAINVAAGQSVKVGDPLVIVG